MLNKYAKKQRALQAYVEHRPEALTYIIADPTKGQTDADVALGGSVGALAALVLNNRRIRVPLPVRTRIAALLTKAVSKTTLANKVVSNIENNHQDLF